MAVNSVTNVPQLLYANGHQSPKIVAKEGAFVDFVGLYCKSSKQRIRRRTGYAAAARASRRSSLINNKWNSINAVLDLERVSAPNNAPHQSSDIKPKVHYYSANWHATTDCTINTS